MVQTGKKREDVGPCNPPKDKRFSSSNQPAPGRIKAGKAKVKFTRELLKQMLSMPYKFAADSQIKQQLIKAYGPTIENMSVAEVMSLQQMQKAVLKGDTQAFSTLMDQALGRPVQAVAQTDTDGNNVKPVYLSLPKGMDISLPENTEGTE